MANKAGEAYAFFHCDAGKAEIKGLLPAIRESVETPSALELELTEGLDVSGDAELMELANFSKKNGRNYVLRAVHPNGTNKDAADELAGVLNQAYNSQLYQPDERLDGKIVYNDNGYVSRE